MKLKPQTIAILILLIASILFFSKTNSTDIIPNEDPVSQKKLDKAITISKFNTDQAILELKSLSDLGEYTEYKKNYILARLHAKKKENKEALSIYEKLLDKNYPLKERVLFHYASLNAQEGNDSTALKYFNKLLRDFPYSKTVPQAKYVMAQTQLRLRYTQAALENLRSLKNDFPKTQFGIATSYYLGEYYYNNKDFEKATQYWREYLKYSPDGRFANEISNILKSQKSFSLIPPDYTLLGDVFFHKKDYANAVYYYRLGNNSKKLYQLGYSLFRLNRKTEAVGYLKEFAYSFPKSKNAKWALYYAGICTPSYLRKAFWEKTGKDIPALEYYTTYKQAVTEENKRQKVKSLENFLSKHPNSEFTLDAAWEIMWEKILDKNYSSAKEIGEKYFNLIDEKSETKTKIGFWLGKISEINGKKDNAIEYYKKTKDILFDNYYSFRAINRLNALNGEKDTGWNLQSSSNELEGFIWSIPKIINPETIKKYFGVTVHELINLQQYDEAIDLIGKSKSPSKQVTAWLKALNNEFETSINISNALTLSYNLNENNPIWELAYPLHFWEYIINTCKNYKNIDPLLVCGVIRQESRFEINALSISEARGLMQLIPPTARSVARQLSLNLNSLEKLNDPDINIKLGINYLHGLLSDFNNPLFAVASYNAGPQAIKRWITAHNQSGTDLDFFVEKIPYEQTRTYVKKVFSSYWTYIKVYKK